MSKREPRRTGRRRLRRLALAAGASGLAALAALTLAATHRPAWYRPAAVDHTRLLADKRELVNLLDRIGEALNNNRPITFELRADQVQRWLVARAEIWPDASVDLGPLRDPVVRSEGDRVQVAATVEGRGLRAVLATTCHAEVRPDSVLIHYEALHLGALPVPVRWAAGMLAGIPDAGPLLAAAPEPGTLALANDWIWPNGHRRYRLRKLEVSDGVAKVTLEPVASRP